MLNIATPPPSGLSESCDPLTAPVEALDGARSQSEEAYLRIRERIVSLAAWAQVHGLALLIAGGQVDRDSKESFSAADLAFQVTGLLQQGIAMVPTRVARKSAPPANRKRRTRSYTSGL